MADCDSQLALSNPDLLFFFAGLFSDFFASLFSDTNFLCDFELLNSVVLCQPVQ